MMTIADSPQPIHTTLPKGQTITRLSSRAIVACMSTLVPRGSRRGVTHMVPILLSLALTTLSVASVSAQAGTFTLGGRVVERGGDLGIAQATVQLGDSSRVVTDGNGRFEIRGIAPGRHSLTVEALGYNTVRTTLLITGAATGTIQMDPAPIPLDPVAVERSSFNLRGRLVDQAGGRPVAFATVRLEGGGETASNDAGHFKLGGLARGRHVIVVEGYGWLPVRAAIELDSDTAVAFELARDGITERIIEQQVARLDERARGVGYILQVIDRQRILESRAATPAMMLAELGFYATACQPGGRMACVHNGGSRPRELNVWIDDHLTFCGLEILAGYPNASIQRIERVGNGVRAYTVWHIERMAAGRAELPPITPFERTFPCR